MSILTGTNKSKQFVFLLETPLSFLKGELSLVCVHDGPIRAGEKFIYYIDCFKRKILKFPPKTRNTTSVSFVNYMLKVQVIQEKA